jgi:hypothetical protein
MGDLGKLTQLQERIGACAEELDEAQQNARVERARELRAAGRDAQWELRRILRADRMWGHALSDGWVRELLGALVIDFDE